MSTQQISDAANLSSAPETDGFDLEAGQKWIYPTNYPVRDYQFNITQQALLKNTLVSLPTGLGKTFIAAVVMYNYFRWYPYGKVIFMAPTRPLVKQQIEACYNITAIPKEATAELTGTTKSAKLRTEVWKEKRVFFITPQVLQNDLANIEMLAPKIKCLVFDEAHRAKGNYAYCEVIRKLSPRNKYFRVLALSATPGNSVRDVLEVLDNLQISHLEFRTDESDDVKPYVFERSLETVVVPLGEKLQQVRTDYLPVLERYTKPLVKYKVILGNCGNLTKGRIFMIKKEFEAKNNAGRTANYNEIMKNLTICLTLYHAYEVLIQHGLRVFLNFYEEHMNTNHLIRNNREILAILEDVRNYLGPSVNIDPLPDGTYPEIPKTAKFGHPKFYKLREILVSHFTTNPSSRVIVFFEYRESVKEAFTMLLQAAPLVKPRLFLGQGSGVTQKVQINVVKSFREGTCNTLLSTCVGEEGLDVGEVDLIVCFDILNKSPIRMIQRMGRTGRKREGRVVVLVTEGKEQQTLKDCIISKHNLGTFVLNSQQLKDGMYPDNPLMVPDGIEPKCEKMHITVQKLTKKGSLKDMLQRHARDFPKFPENIEVIEIEERLGVREELWNQRNPLATSGEGSGVNFGKYLERQRTFQPCGLVKHSKESKILVSLLQFADSKRFNIPVTQDALSEFSQMRSLKQSDIRTMFTKPTAPLSSQEYRNADTLPIASQKEKAVLQGFPDELFTELSDYLTIQMSLVKSCKFCENLYECPKTFNKPPAIDSTQWLQPNDSIFDRITEENLEAFVASLNPKSPTTGVLDDTWLDDIDFSQQFESDVFTTPSRSEKEKSFAFETPKSFSKVLKRHAISPDQSENASEIGSVLAFFRLTRFEDLFVREDNSGLNADKTVVSSRSNSRNSVNTSCKVFIDSRSELNTTSTSNETLNAPSISSSLNANKTFITSDKDSTEAKFGSLNDSCEWNEVIDTSLDDGKNWNKVSQNGLFKTVEDSGGLNAGERLDMDSGLNASSDTSINYSPNVSKSNSVSHDAYASPDLFEDSSSPNLQSPLSGSRSIQKSPESPILCTFDRSQRLKAKRKIFDNSQGEVAKRPNLGNLKDTRKSFSVLSRSESLRGNCDSSSTNSLSKARDFKIGTKKNIDRIEKTTTIKVALETSDSSVESSAKRAVTKSEADLSIFDISDVCDLSAFGFSDPKSVVAETSVKLKAKEEKQPSNLDISEICDLSIFGLTNNNLKSLKPASTQPRPPEAKKLSCFNISDICDIPALLSTSTSTLGTTNRDSIVVLSDSDSSPEKPADISSMHKRTQTQLGITQMLSLVSKLSSTETETSGSQKENCSDKNQFITFRRKDVVTNSSKKTLKLKEPGNNEPPKSKVASKIFDISIDLNSEDEFEEKSPVVPKIRSVLSGSSRKRMKTSRVVPAKRTQNPKKLFIEDEAEVADPENVSEDEDSGEDRYETSFIADDTLGIPNTQMQAEYLKSVRSPPVRGKFKITQRNTRNISSVFSQEVTNEDNNYLDDTFCVGSDEVEDDHDLSELEVLELKLKEMKKRKKKAKSQESGAKKTRRIVLISDESE